MPNTIKHLRSSTPGAKPLAARLDGQIAINSADKALFVLDSTGAVSTVATEAAVTAATTAVQTVNGKTGTSVTLAPADIGTNGVAPLDATGKVDLSNLPTLVESVNGKTGAVTLAPTDIGTNGVAPLDATGKVDLANLPALVQSVNGKTGVAVLGPADIGTDGVAALDASGKIATAVVPDVVLGSLHYMGTWNAATNTPTLPDPTLSKGQYYVVSTAGTQFGKTFGVDSWVVSDGTTWGMVGAPESVTSVAGKVGDVVLATSDITSGTFTADRLGGTPGNSLVLVTDATGLTKWVPQSSVAGQLTELLVVDLSAGDVALSTAQWTSFWVFSCTGNTVARTLTLPALARTALVKNTGTSTLTLQVFGGGSAVVSAAETVMVYSDGTNLTVVGGGDAVYPPFTGNAGKVLTVNSGETGVEWDTAGSDGATAFTSLTDTFPSYAGKNGQLLRVNSAGTGIESANNTEGVPHAEDFPFTFNKNCSLVDSVEGLVFDGGSALTGDIAGACVKAVPSGEFEVEAKIGLGRSSLGNWAALGIGFYGASNYVFGGIRFDSGYSISATKNSDAGNHVDISELESYGRGILGGWVSVRRFSPSSSALLLGFAFAEGASTLAFTGWTNQRQENSAGASGCLATISGFTPSTTANVTVTSSASVYQNFCLLPINSVDGSTIPTLRAATSASSSWTAVDVPIPVGAVVGDAIIIGVRHTIGVLFPDALNWKVQHNYNAPRAAGSGLTVSKILTAADLTSGHVTFTAPSVGNGCWFCAVIEAGTFSTIGVSLFFFAGSVATTTSFSSNTVQLIYSTDRYWLESLYAQHYDVYFAAPPTHVGFCVWTNRSSGVASIICTSWKQSW